MVVIKLFQRYLALLGLFVLIAYTPVVWERSSKKTEIIRTRLDSPETIAASVASSTTRQRTHSETTASTTTSKLKPTTTPEAVQIRCSELASYEFPNATIPPIVHWTSKDGRVPAKLVPIVQSWRRLINTNGSNWRFMHWDDEQISRLIAKHYPLLHSSYAKLSNGLERSDIGRLVVLHHVGGLYVDTDVELLRDLTPLLTPSIQETFNYDDNGCPVRGNYSTCPWAYWSQEPVEHAVFLFNVPRLISNAVMLSRANHSFLSYVLNSWPAWFEQNWGKKSSRNHGQAVHVTGPGMLQNFYNMYVQLQLSANERAADWCEPGQMLANPDRFQPVWDTGYIPKVLKRVCAKASRLSEMKKRHCRRLTDNNFETEAVPSTAYTLHRFMHLSYTYKMNMFQAKPIYQLLPILRCRID